MSTIDFQCLVESETANGERRVIAERRFEQQSVMKIGIVRTWVRKAYNRALREAGRDVIVSARYQGQMKRAPHTIYTGLLSGVNGETLRHDGGLEE